jgi:hypothetical protein
MTGGVLPWQDPLVTPERTRRHGYRRGSSAPRLNVGYSALPQRVKKEVQTYAKLGERHPDPVVASSALSWARGFRPSRALAFDVLFSIVELVLSVATGAGSLTFNYTDRRTAKRLLAIEARSSQLPTT